MNNDDELQLIEDVASFTHNPLNFVKYIYEWRSGELEDASGLRKWQEEEFAAIRDHFSNQKTRFTPYLSSVASGHGIGKSAFIGMLSCWAMSTCEDCKIVTTANTENQLRTKTMPEITKWFRLALNSHWFKYTATAIYSSDAEHEKSWRQDFVPWSVSNTEAFAGLHNKNKRIVLIFDEASNINDLVWEVAEGALTDENTEIIWIAFGNPTRNTGRFRECFRKFKHRWRNRRIDSRTVDGTNKEQLQKWVDDYGEDSDFVKVRVRGVFPDSSESQFIAQSYIDNAMRQVILEHQVSHAPVIIGVDPAYTGNDDTVIYMRQGLFSKKLFSMPKVTDHIWLAEKLAGFEDKYKADAVFIDYGYGMTLKNVGDNWGRNWQLVQFGSASSDPQYLNKRGDIWSKARDWLRDGGSIDDQQTADDFAMPEHYLQLKTSKIVLEAKEDIKKRLGVSPNCADALALTFSAPVIKSSLSNQTYSYSNQSGEYDRENL